MSLLFSLERAGWNGMLEDVLVAYDFSITMPGSLIAYTFCAFPFATVYTEDLEHRYIRYSMIRGNLKSYVLSKTVVIYLSSVLVMLAGTLLFLILCRTHLPWAVHEPESYNAVCYKSLLESGQHLLYCVMTSLHLGVIAGALSSVAAMCSVFISNRAFVLAIPLVLFRILLSVRIGPHGFYNIYSLYAYNKYFSQDWMNLLLVVAISMLPLLPSIFGSYQGLKRKL